MSSIHGIGFRYTSPPSSSVQFRLGQRYGLALDVVQSRVSYGLTYVTECADFIYTHWCSRLFHVLCGAGISSVCIGVTLDGRLFTCADNVHCISQTEVAVDGYSAILMHCTSELQQSTW
eukprot:COSAG01_NODE_70_length_28755_cov_34.709067_15_plen_119_part_00